MSLFVFTGLVLCAVPGLYLSAAPVEAPVRLSRWQRCSDFFTALVYRYQTPHLSPEEKRIWGEWLSPDGEWMAVYPNRISNDTLFDAYTRIPPLVRDRIEAMPADRGAGNLYLGDIARQLRRSVYSTLIENVREVYFHQRDFHKQKLPPFGEWLRQRLVDREAKLSADPSLATTWRRAHAALVEEHRASQNWLEAYSVPLPYEKLGGNRIRVKIGPHAYEGEVRGQQTYLWVPSDEMVHPAWNPVSEMSLMNMARDRVPPPSAWLTSVGLNGKFYIQDGNHRFALYAKKEAWVIIPFPPRTDSLRVFLDAWGVAQPPRDKIMQFYRNEISVWSLLPQHARERLILMPAESRGTFERTALPK